MDYLRQPFWFKIKKALRYAGMYGPSRTYIKILGQRHMRQRYDSLPAQIGHRQKKQTVGIVGCGNYSFTTIAYFLERQFGRVIGACADIDLNRAASFARQYDVPFYTDNADEILADKKIRLVYIASNHATHAEYAIRALEAGKDVYIEKPHVVTPYQLHGLFDAMYRHSRKVFLGFNRPGSRFGKLVQKCLELQGGSGMYNWFVVGHHLKPDHWYLKRGEGGRILGNLCHWTDFTMRLVPRESTFPVTIIPVRYDEADGDIAVSYLFTEGSTGAIAFSSKGEAFEGVRESFRAQKGDAVVALDDFKQLTIDIGPCKKTYKNFHRDHGHRANIVAAYANVHRDLTYHRDNETWHIINTAWLFLKTKEALEANQRLTIDSYENSFAAGALKAPAASPSPQIWTA